MALSCTNYPANVTLVSLKFQRNLNLLQKLIEHVVWVNPERPPKVDELDHVDPPLAALDSRDNRL
jgi:hypothetical protein